MKRRTQNRTARWSDRTSPVELASPYVDTPPKRREPRLPHQAAGLGPYEATYDISLGYGHERSIDLR